MLHTPRTVRTGVVDAIVDVHLQCAVTAPRTPRRTLSYLVGDAENSFQARVSARAVVQPYFIRKPKEGVCCRRPANKNNV